MKPYTGTKPATQIHFEDVQAGDSLPTLRKGPITTTHLMRWSAAIENWHKIHYDQEFATKHDKLPGILVNGMLKQQFVIQLLKDWAGHEGWMWKARLQFRAMDFVGSTLDVWGKVEAKTRLEEYGLIELKVGIKTLEGRESTQGDALVALPFSSGKPVPYPFVPPRVDPWGAPT